MHHWNLISIIIIKKDRVHKIDKKTTIKSQVRYLAENAIKGLPHNGVHIQRSNISSAPANRFPVER